jgi:hypothetical protein
LVGRPRDISGLVGDGKDAGTLTFLRFADFIASGIEVICTLPSRPALRPTGQHFADHRDCSGRRFAQVVVDPARSGAKPCGQAVTCSALEVSDDWVQSSKAPSVFCDRGSLGSTNLAEVCR